MPETFRTEEFKVEGEKLLAKIKELIHEGNIRKVIIKDKDGKTLMEDGNSDDIWRGRSINRSAARRHWSHRRVVDRSNYCR